MRRIGKWMTALRDDAWRMGWQLGHLRTVIAMGRENARRRVLRDIVAEHEARLSGYRGRRSLSS